MTQQIEIEADKAASYNSLKCLEAEFCEVGADKQLLSNEKNTLLEGGAIFGEGGRLRWV